jgi:shikimate dehydrogenase
MRLVTTLLGASPDAMVRQARRARTPWLEVRLDALRSGRPGGLPALRRALGKPAIATCRPVAQGGRFLGSEAEREAWLRAAIAARFAAVDLEASAPLLRRLAPLAAREGLEVIVSRHDLEGPAEDAAQLARAVPPGGVAKYAARVRGPEDLVALLRVAAAFRAQSVRFAVMGLGDASLRVLAPLLGSELVYCAPPEGEPAAPGQLPAELVMAAHAALPPAPRVRGPHRLVLLLGDPVAHSASPAMQNAAFAAQGDALVYAAVRVRAPQLGAAVQALRALDAAGANVTTPLKERALAHLDSLAPEAEEARAANTVVARAGRLRGHNTDGPGALAALREAGAQEGPALVLGAGATGRAVAHALARSGMHVLVANRTPARARGLARAVAGASVPLRRAALRDGLARARVVVNCTTLGRRGAASPLPAALLHEKLAVLDAVYRPGGTPLLRAARRRGCLAVPGEAMLLHQGALAYTLWTGKQAPLGAMRAALRVAREGA